MSHHDLLRSITSAAAKAGPGRSLAVFDLDSTLFDLRLRNQEIIHAFAREARHQAQWPEQTQKMLEVQIERKDWGLREPLARVGVAEAEHEDLLLALRAHWTQEFFSARYLSFDRPVPGSREYLGALINSGAHILYLTGRDVPRMQSGTEESLREWDFPLGGREARLLLKPDAALDDAEFKAELLEHECSRYDRIWFFENEPINLRVARDRCPSVELILLDTNHSGREQPWAELARIPHFETDLGTKLGVDINRQRVR